MNGVFARLGSIVLLVAGAIWMAPHGDFGVPDNFVPFLAGMAMMTAGYLLALRAGLSCALWFWTVAAGLRFIVLPMEPGDDLYRYLWEGRVLGARVNPYLHPPSAPELAAFRDVLWPRINHPDVSAIYPPLTELLFAVLSLLGAGVAGFKLCFTVADLVVCGLLLRRFGVGRAIRYAWNPLAIYSFAGGGHADSWLILALVASWLAWDASLVRPGRAVFFAGVAVACKWIAAPLVVWMLWRRFRAGARREAIVLGGLAVLPFALAWAMIGWHTGEWTGQIAPSAFARTARSAALLPQLADWCAGRHVTNELFVLPLLLSWAAVILRARSFAGAAEWSLFAAFVWSPLVHAWYFPWILPFAASTGNRGSLALNGTGLIYFLLPHRAALGEPWMLTGWEWLLLWAPFVAGFLWKCGARNAANTQ